MRRAPDAGEEAPWRQRFRAPAIWWTQIAQGAPTRGLAASNRSGVYQLYAWQVPTGELTQITHKPGGALEGLLSPDGRYIIYLDDRAGDEIGHYVRVLFEGGPPEDITPDLPPYSSWSVSASPASNVIGLTAADAEGFHVYSIDLGPEGAMGAPRLLYHSQTLTFGPYLSHGGEIAVVASSERTGLQRYSLIALEGDTGERVSELWDGRESSVTAIAFSPLRGDTRLLGTTDRTGVRRPLIWNARTGERTDVTLDEMEGEIIPLDWSADGERILMCQFLRAVQRLYTYDLARAELRALDHPGGTFELDGATYWGPDGAIWAHWQDSTHPSQLVALNTGTGRRERVVLAEGKVPPSRPWRSVSFRSADGEQIQGWLSRPAGAGPFPTILHTHGGPAFVTTESYSPASQFWLDQGFAYLTINFRGSTTFGKAFQEQVWGNPGQWELEDMAAAREWLLGQGIARPDQILLTGGSYGGFLTLLALGKQPELWAGGMAVRAIADWATMYEDSADTLRAFDVTLFGGTPGEKPEAYAASSPITYAERVAAPVLIIQGRNDTRTPPRQVEQYEARMRALGKPIEVHWFSTGHSGSYAQVDQAIEDHEMMLQFARRVLGC